MRTSPAIEYMASVIAPARRRAQPQRKLTKRRRRSSYAAFAFESYRRQAEAPGWLRLEGERPKDAVAAVAADVINAIAALI
jgi:hypothetical protein